MRPREDDRPAGEAGCRGVAADDSRVVRALQEYQAALRAGHSPTRQEFQARHRDIAAVLGECLDGLDIVRAVVEHLSEPGAAHAAGLDPEEALGDYRIVREIGRGGMGVVYEAEQISLGRRVALKVLPLASTLDAQQLQRFKNEARAAAHLHHTNIVPVYATGCEGGVHYYAMQFIDGRSLAAVIEELRHLAGLPKHEAAALPPVSPAGEMSTDVAAALSTECATPSPAFFRAVARLGVQAAAALEYAHGQGVVHRDVKPANLLLDGQGRLWVTDFGLARVQSDPRLTLPGDVVGTLRYMSPEQALAQPIGVDHRADLYSLGATLYELLTLTPVFPGRDRQELLRQIAFEEPKPPRRVRKEVPAELETIVLKALAKTPAERYATARELAEDLERFLKDEPIRARRPTPVQRARKWARRHRPVVWSAAVASLVALAVVTGSVGWVVRDRAARRAGMAADLQVALEQAHQARRDRKWPQALAAAQRAAALLRDGAAEPALADQVRDLLRELAEEEADGQLVARLEELRLLQAEVKLNDNSYTLERALPDYRQAFRSYGWAAEALTPAKAATLLRRRPPAVRGVLLAALEHWLILARHLKAPEADWVEQVLSEADTDDWRRRVRAARGRNDRPALEQLAREVNVAAQPPEALYVLSISLRQRRAPEAAAALLRRAQEAFPGDFWMNHDLGVVLQKCEPSQYGEAVRFLTAAMALRPQNPGVRHNLAMALRRAGRLDEAAAAFRQAIALKPEYPAAHSGLGLVLLDKGRPDEAAAAFRQVVRLKPGSADAHYDLGNALRVKGDLDEAIAAYRQALRLKPDHAEAHCNLGVTLSRQGEFVPALAALERGHELGSRRPDWPYPSAQWVRTCRQLVEFDARAQAILRGAAPPATAAELSECARHCYTYRQRYVAAARFWADAFTADPQLADDLRAANRYGAARAAALAGAGRGSDAGPLSSADRGRWRQQAREWLRADLGATAGSLESRDPEERRWAGQRLRQLRCEPDLAGLRDPAAVARLPADEQAACKQVWAEVDALLGRAGAAR
jgi:serine/threonine protein kinase/Flp pilus assembly protein TadD